MTLTPYNPQMLDQLALRLLDLAASVRQMAIRSREHPIESIAVHDKKACEWIANLERWARKSLADVEMRILEARAGHRAMSRAEQCPPQRTDIVDKIGPGSMPNSGP